ncbi:MAG: hypothetical protein AB7F59_04475 [Bdellovibrionales bacterium]
MEHAAATTLLAFAVMIAGFSAQAKDPVKTAASVDAPAVAELHKKVNGVVTAHAKKVRTTKNN